MCRKKSSLNTFGVAAFSINPYENCVFKCSYCYIRESFGENFGIESKPNTSAITEIIKKKYSLEGESWIMSAHTDPYPKIERSRRITRKCLEELLKINFKNGVVATKSDIILDDVKLLKKFGKKLTVGITITSDLASVVKSVEPRCIEPEYRLSLASKLRNSGIYVRTLVSPLLDHSPQFAEKIANVSDSVFIESDPFYNGEVDEDFLTKSEIKAFTAKLSNFLSADKIVFGRHLLLSKNDSK